MSKDSFTTQYFDIIEESAEYLEQRVESLQSKLETTSNKGSIEGMIYTSNKLLEASKKFLKNGFVGKNIDERKEIIAYLLQHDFIPTYNNNRTPNEPEFEHNGGGFRHLRVRVNEGGIILLLDPACTLQITIGRTIININQKRIDFSKYSLKDMKKGIQAFVERSLSREKDKKFIEEIIRYKTNEGKKYILNQCGY